MISANISFYLRASGLAELHLWKHSRVVWLHIPMFIPYLCCTKWWGPGFAWQPTRRQFILITAKIYFIWRDDLAFVEFIFNTIAYIEGLNEQEHIETKKSVVNIWNILFSAFWKRTNWVNERASNTSYWNKRRSSSGGGGGQHIPVLTLNLLILMFNSAGHLEYPTIVQGI